MSSMRGESLVPPAWGHPDEVEPPAPVEGFVTVPPPPVDGGPLFGVVGAMVGVPVGVPTVGTLVVPPLPISISSGGEASSAVAQAMLTRKVDAIVAVRRAMGFV